MHRRIVVVDKKVVEEMQERRYDVSRAMDQIYTLVVQMERFNGGCVTELQAEHK